LANMTTPTAEAPEGYCQTTCDRCLATTAPALAPTAAPTVVPQPPPAPIVFSPPPPPPPAATPSPTATTPPQSVTQPPPAPVTFSPPPPPPSPTSPNLQVCDAQICYLTKHGRAAKSLYREQSMVCAALVCWMLLLLPLPADCISKPGYIVFLCAKLLGHACSKHGHLTWFSCFH